VLVEDIFASEHREALGVSGSLGEIRDPSHVRVLPLSEHLRSFSGGWTGD